MSGISQGYFAFVRHQIENGMNRMNELWHCRTPQNVAAVQVSAGQHGESLQSGRRMADISLKPWTMLGGK